MEGEQQQEFPRLEIEPISVLKGSYAMLGDKYWLFVGITAVGMIISNALFLVLAGPMFCGIAICYLKHMRGETVQFETLFKGFDHFVESLIATAILLGVSVVAMIPLGIFVGLVAFVTRTDFLIAMAFGLAGLVYAALSLVIWGVTMFVHPLIVDRKMKAVPALKLSVAAVRANLVPILILLLVMAFLAGLASAFLVLPVFLVIPINFGAGLMLYRELFPDTGAALE